MMYSTSTMQVALSEAIHLKELRHMGILHSFQFCSCSKSFLDYFSCYGQDVIGAENALLEVLLERHFKSHVSAGFPTSLASLEALRIMSSVFSTVMLLGCSHGALSGLSELVGSAQQLLKFLAFSPKYTEGVGRLVPGCLGLA